MMFINNPEVKKFIARYFTIVLIAIGLAFGVSLLSINIIKQKVIENNQTIVGKIVSNNPELENQIVDIITQGNLNKDLKLGKEILAKYNYNQNISLLSEPIISQSINKIYILNIAFIMIMLLLVLIIVFIYFSRLYKDIKDMTEYVYHSSEGRRFDMKNRNQEGQIGLLKTELLKMTNILQEKAELLQKEKIFLNDTMSDISHQLRTPMTSLMILNDLMYDDLPNEVKVDFLDKIKHQLNRMDWLIKSMLKLSKVDAKVIEFKKEKINIKELIHRATAPTIVPMEMKNQNLIIEGDDTSSYIGDMSWSVEALVNIIKNCVEHTKENGQIYIGYEENPIYSKIIIKDSGEGIDKKDLPNIFKRFYRGKSSSKTESVGIGLAMAKSIINSQNGDISVSSEKNKGTTFNITFHKNYSD